MRADYMIKIRDLMSYLFPVFSELSICIQKVIVYPRFQSSALYVLLLHYFSYLLQITTVVDPTLWPPVDACLFGKHTYYELA